MPSPNLYRTSDLYFAAFLCSLEIALETTEEQGDNSRKVIFVFKLEESKLRRLKSLYFGGSGTVKARGFVDHIRSLKSMCYV